jgi:hypothetical protein
VNYQDRSSLKPELTGVMRSKEARELLTKLFLTAQTVQAAKQDQHQQTLWKKNHKKDDRLGEGVVGADRKGNINARKHIERKS